MHPLKLDVSAMIEPFKPFINCSTLAVKTKHAQQKFRAEHLKNPESPETHALWDVYVEIRKEFHAATDQVEALLMEEANADQKDTNPGPQGTTDQKVSPPEEGRGPVSTMSA
jgi:hypothetical protein